MIAFSLDGSARIDVIAHTGEFANNEDHVVEVEGYLIFWKPEMNMIPMEFLDGWQISLLGDCPA